jgi:tetratricopeptide (TPR) repeat protein
MYPEAEADLRRVLAIRPDFLEAKDQLCGVLLADGVRRQKDELVAEGERLGREIIDADPGHALTWDRMSWLTGIYWSNRKLDRYYALLQFLYAHNPTDALTGLNLGGVARRYGAYDEARRAYEGLLDVSPDDPDVLNDLGILHDGEGDRDGARRLWKRVLEEEPDNMNALVNLMTDAWERGATEDAASYLERGLAAARAQNGPVERWLWFRDRLRYLAPKGFGG